VRPHTDTAVPANQNCALERSLPKPSQEPVITDFRFIPTEIRDDGDAITADLGDLGHAAVRMARPFLNVLVLPLPLALEAS